MDLTWTLIITFLGVYTLAIISPGPNFILVTNTALNDSRRTGIFTALGVATGSGLFALAGLAGVLVLVHSLPYFALIMRIAGGGYLVWLGFDMFRNSRRRVPTATRVRAVTNRSPRHAFQLGLLTNLTNPKAWAFYLSLFALVMMPDFPLWGKVFLNSAMFLISFLWYATVTLLVSSQTFRPIFLGLQPIIQRGLAVLLILLGGKVLFS